MSKESTAIDSLRSARKADDALTHLVSNSLENAATSVAEALASEGWKHGPASLRATYGTIKSVVATNRRGQTVRVPVTQTEGKIELGIPEVFDVAMPLPNIAAEMIETAKCASISILEGKDDAGEILRSMSRAMNVSPDLNRRISLEVGVKSLSVPRWYHEVVEENFTDEVDIPQMVEEGRVTEDNLSQAITNLTSFMVTEFKALSESLVAYRATGGSDKGVIGEAACGLTEEFKCAIGLFKAANHEDTDELVRVFESVASVTPRMVAGARFLVNFTQSEIRRKNHEHNAAQ